MPQPSSAAPTSLRPRAHPGGLLPRLNTRWPLFEMALFLVVLALAWAAFRADHASRQLKRPPALTQETLEIPEILKLHTLMEIKDRYAGLADQLESGLAELGDALQSFVRDKDRTEVGRYLRKSQGLEAWLRQQQENVDRRKLQMLREWLRTRAPAGAAGANAIVLNLDQLLNRAEESYSNYLAAVRLSEGQPLTPDLVQKKLAKAAEPEQELLRLARQAREQAARLEAFVVQQPAELARRARSRAETEGVAAFVAQVQTALQPLCYLLVPTLIVQCVLLMVALYERIVVAPLREKLIEDNTAIEHQKKLDHFARLAIGLAHEIRNPLTAINVRLFTLQKSMSKGTGEHNDAALIRDEIDRLEQILKNFLKLARPSEPKFVTLTAEPTLREVQEFFEPQLQPQGIQLKLDSMASTPFQADPLQLKQVLINLIQNAADSIGREGTITLRARPAEGRRNGQIGGSIVLEVEDTGTGIAPEVQERLFDPFFSTKENGTGLGLPIAAKIIDQHQGRLDFETRLGHGSVFRIILPGTAY